jgi:hypothetical protein
MAYNLYINGARTDTYNSKKISSVTLNNVEYAIQPILQCTVAGLGSSSPSSVTFTNNTIKDWTPEIVTFDGVSFAKFPTFYRKVISSADSQITSFTIADAKIDNAYQPYPCFVKEDGTTVMDYILVAVDRFSTSSTIADGRTYANQQNTTFNRSGYQLYDWMIHKLFQDLAICKLQTINTNSGSGITSLLGINWGSTSDWIDGIASPSSDNYWVFSYKPSCYVNEPSSSTTGYQAVNYARPTTSGEISKLGYDTSHPFVNYPNSVVSNSSYNTYYCDQYYYSSGSRPVRCYVAFSDSYYGVFSCYSYREWSYPYGVRLCYRPIEN